MKDLFNNAKEEITDLFQSITQQSKADFPLSLIKEIQSETLQLAWNCALMIEKYNFAVFTKSEDTATSFNKEDMKLWKEIYYPKLVKTNIIHDTTFFDLRNKDASLGVGSDGVFLKLEYSNLRYQLYSYIYKEYIQNKLMRTVLLSQPLHSCVNNVCTMIISYIPHSVPNNPNQLYTFAPEDMKLWKEYYYPVLVASSLLSDYSLMDSHALRKNYGIGDDGVASCCDLQHFVSEAYRFILLPIYIQINYKLHE